MPFAPGYVPKYVSNERFSCMMITTWRILAMPPGLGRDPGPNEPNALGLGVAGGASGDEEGDDQHEAGIPGTFGSSHPAQDRSHVLDENPRKVRGP
jgi:hypothetical protein